MQALERKPAPGGGAGEIENHRQLAINTIAPVDFQELGNAAGAVVASLAVRRENWIIRRCRVAPSVARAVAVELFGGCS